MPTRRFFREFFSDAWPAVGMLACLAALFAPPIAASSLAAGGSPSPAAGAPAGSSAPPGPPTFDMSTVWNTEVWKRPPTHGGSARFLCFGLRELARSTDAPLFLFEQRTVTEVHSAKVDGKDVKRAFFLGCYDRKSDGVNPLRMGDRVIVVIQADKSLYDRIARLSIGLTQAASSPIIQSPLQTGQDAGTGALNIGTGAIQPAAYDAVDCLLTPGERMAPEAQRAKVCANSGLDRVAFPPGQAWDSEESVSLLRAIRTRLDRLRDVDACTKAEKSTPGAAACNQDPGELQAYIDKGEYCEGCLWFEIPDALRGDTIPTLSVTVQYRQNVAGSLASKATLVCTGSDPNAKCDPAQDGKPAQCKLAAKDASCSWGAMSVAPGFDSICYSALAQGAAFSCTSGASGVVTCTLTAADAACVPTPIAFPTTYKSDAVLTDALPQVHSISRYNLVAGYVRTTVANPTYAWANPSATPPSRGTVVSSSPHTGDPALFLTWYPWGHDAESISIWSLPSPFSHSYQGDSFALDALKHSVGLSAGFSLLNPATNLYFGLTLIPIDGIELQYGAAVTRVGVLASPALIASITPSASNSPPTTQEWKTGSYVGLTFDVGSFLKRVFK